MISLKPVKDCPHSRKAIGVVSMPPELIAQLAAAVKDTDEWAILLLGERLNNGYEVNVSDYRVPPQSRSGGHVSIDEFDNDAEIVGVVHSHHSMGAFFSGTDTATLNPRFPVSIVIAHGATTYLGFKYLGTGKVILPCGSVGEIEFKIQPLTGPVVASVSQVTHETDNLGDCNRHSDTAEDAFHVRKTASCGLAEPQYLRAAAFGSSSDLLDLVSKLDRPVIVSGVKSIAGQPMSQAQVKDDPDSDWCKVHSLWDYCSYSAQVSMGNSRWCKEHSRWNDQHECTKGVVQGFLEKGKEIVERQAGGGTAGPKQLTDDREYCFDCGGYDTFEDWVCDTCGAPYCISCGEGHYGPCVQSEGKCRCGAVIVGNYTYCSEACLGFYEPVSEVEVGA